jgi:hypothetical protein
MDLPFDIISNIISQADLAIDTHLSLRKNKNLHIVRRVPLTIQDDIKQKLDTFLTRRVSRFNARKTHSDNAWVSLDEFEVHMADNGDRVVSVVIDELGDNTTRMSFKISRIDHVNEEMWTLNETCVDVNSGKVCDKWIYV